jgi:ferric iron reductase protein FhuF
MTDTALAGVAAIGPFFAWEELDERSDGWRPLTDLDDPGVVAERVRVARAMLVERFGLTPVVVPERVLASVLFLGLAARLVSPPLAVLATAGVLLAPRRDRLWWWPVDGGPVPVAYAAVTTTHGDRFGERIIDGLVTPLLAVFQDRFRLSPKVLYGNVASALGGAVTMLRGARPESADRAGRIVERLLRAEPLVGSSTIESPQWTLRRINCCLYYRIPGGGYCGDCVLRRNR